MNIDSDIFKIQSNNVLPSRGKILISEPFLRDSVFGRSVVLLIDHTKEGRILEHHLGDVVLFNVYFPNGQQSEERLAHKMKFYRDFLAHCEALRAKGKGIIICGDVNTAHREIDLTHPKANEDTSGFLPIERALDRHTFG